MTEEEQSLNGRVMEDAKQLGLRERTTDYARRIIRLYRSLPKETVAQTLGGNSCVAALRWAQSSRKHRVGVPPLSLSPKQAILCANWMRVLTG